MKSRENFVKSREFTGNHEIFRKITLVFRSEPMYDFNQMGSKLGQVGNYVKSREKREIMCVKFRDILFLVKSRKIKKSS